MDLQAHLGEVSANLVLQVTLEIAMDDATCANESPTTRRTGYAHIDKPTSPQESAGGCEAAATAVRWKWQENVPWKHCEIL